MSRRAKTNRRRCACFVIPPGMLAEIASRTADPVERRRAMESLAVTHQFIGGRRAMSSVPAATRDPSAKYRLVYDAHARRRLPGGLTRREGQPPLRDAAADEAFDGAGVVYDFFERVFRRKSLDNKGLMLLSTVHYGRDYDNAFWRGDQMVYGDGDGRLFRRFTASLDIIAHELSHGFTQFCSDLDYQDQSGALNEHLSDVFGIMARQWATGQTAETADWLVGAGVYAPGVNGRGLRDMKNPGTAYDDRLLGKDPQPGHMQNYVVTDDDNGGVHINSGIPNRAFCLACLGAGGRPWETVGKVWYEVAAKKVWADAGFQDMADLTAGTARDLFGDGSAVHRAVREGWREVGITPA